MELTEHETSPPRGRAPGTETESTLDRVSQRSHPLFQSRSWACMSGVSRLTRELSPVFRVDPVSLEQCGSELARRVYVAAALAHRKAVVVTSVLSRHISIVLTENLAPQAVAPGPRAPPGLLLSVPLPGLDGPGGAARRRLASCKWRLPRPVHGAAGISTLAPFCAERTGPVVWPATCQLSDTCLHSVPGAAGPLDDGGGQWQGLAAVLPGGLFVLRQTFLTGCHLCPASVRKHQTCMPLHLAHPDWTGD
ncbi:uncharacterized protein LOC106733249 [Tupaia chinensis]|uniref:uncharacterized protein LOC106733249 n=1 Tax=Tupaia chinensis TaxID=246437 RepID=UPI000704496D|nr:uncharacterized protein LOC106733249 [Tupaia chinensis]